jgi:hypothetical protein
MKKSEIKLRSIISERIRSILNEKFGSQEAAALNKRVSSGGRWGDSMMQKLSKQHQIAWDLVDGSAFGNSADSGASVLNFFFVDSNKTNPFKGNSWDGTISAGLIGITQGKKVAGYNSSRFSQGNALGSVDKASSRAGSQAPGIHNFKRYSEVADTVITLDLSKVKGTAADKVENRKAAKEGAAALVSAKDVLKQNRSRYEEALTDRHAGAGLESVEKMLELAHRIFSEALDNDIKTLKSGFYEDSWGGRFDEAKNLYRRMVDEYKKFVEMAATAKKKAGKQVDGWDEGAYYAKRLPGISRSMQQYLQEFKTKMKAPNADKKIPIVRN